MVKHQAIVSMTLWQTVRTATVMDFFFILSLELRYFVRLEFLWKRRFVRVKTSHILNLIIFLKLTECETMFYFLSHHRAENPLTMKKMGEKRTLCKSMVCTELQIWLEHFWWPFLFQRLLFGQSYLCWWHTSSVLHLVRRLLKFEKKIHKIMN